ncbi:hypothetical protein QJS04_geneDACA014268 [Acorus gramineus]|uniref:Small ribosomal subunit protein uS5c n=1 Tax=Acorus gramineus TaxID=55184 RepID=A0AAV9BTU2_ACOGR|nr:hypothetical protein QJS04_geneDACA014268 [Acorus gramineus]
MASTTLSSLSTTFSSLSLIHPSQPSLSTHSFLSFKPRTPTPIKASSSSSTNNNNPNPNKSPPDNTIFFNQEETDPQWVDTQSEPLSPPEGFVAPPSFDELPPETEEEVAAAYEEIYGPAYSGVSILGSDVFVMDSKVKKQTGFGGTKRRRERPKDGFDERVVQVRRVTKVVKGGKQMSFRAVVVVGDKNGQVGVGVGSAKEIATAVEKSATNARRNIITVPMTKYATFPHRSDGDYGAAKVMLRPASPGTGVIAGGAVRIVLEMAGVDNALGKQLGSNNALNNARATVVAVQKMRQFKDVALERGIPMEELWK